jgi:signal transduction histidine kinase
MLTTNFNVEKFIEIFPQLENILQCGVYFHDPINNETYWSKGVYTILGLDPYSTKSSFFDNFAKFVVEEDRQRVVDEVTRSREKKIPYKIEFSIINAKGIYKRLYSENTFHNEENDFSGEYKGIIRDISESYFYKKALEQKVTELDKSNQDLEEFAYIASHDLQEPLRKISTFTGRLSSRFQGKLGEEGDMYVQRILSSTQNMQVLLEDLLNFSRLSSKDKQFEMTSLQKCFDDSISDLEVKIEETKALVACESLPEILGYPSQIKQLFFNLLSNAVKFRKPNEPPVIRISCEEISSTKYPDLDLQKDQNYLKITFEDNGIGFEQEFSERIFLMFQRLNGKAEYSGSGIGLSICKKIVENHKGFIFANGILGKGALFTILLPNKKT